MERKTKIEIGLWIFIIVLFITAFYFSKPIIIDLLNKFGVGFCITLVQGR